MTRNGRGRRSVNPPGNPHPPLPHPSKPGRTPPSSFPVPPPCSHHRELPGFKDFGVGVSVSSTAGPAPTVRTARQQGTRGPHALLVPRPPHLRAPCAGDPAMASNSSSCPTPGGGHLNGYPVPPYAFFFPHMLGGLSPPSTLAGIQHQLPVSGYSTPSPASEYCVPAGAGGTPSAGGVCGDPSGPGSVPSMGCGCQSQAAAPALVRNVPQGSGAGEVGSPCSPPHLWGADFGGFMMQALGAAPHVFI
ncbi:retinoic acid receptor alpha [Corvus cornix cornix]|uniref:retinoic acid receptor alpha n=1 Tax=Corvus cornix cornix TaxID=932674 RepID=UPI001951EF77|nr:retinoic acid receptor alpha [Corvus cornix cornix]